MTEMPSSGIAIIDTPRRFQIFMRHTTTPHSSLLTRARSFQTESKGSTPPGLTLNPEPYFLFTSFLFVLYYPCE